MSATTPARILLVMPEHWERVLLRAELIERGYDVVGAEDLDDALLYRPVDEERGPVELIVVDQNVLVEPDARLLDWLISRHESPGVLLLAGHVLEQPEGPWRAVVRRPVLIDELASKIEQLMVRGRAAAPVAREESGLSQQVF